MTPRLRSSGVSVRSLFNAPRSLKAPVRCWLSSLRKMEFWVRPENVSDGVHGETRMSARILASAVWMSESWIMAGAAHHIGDYRFEDCRFKDCRWFDF